MDNIPKIDVHQWEQNQATNKRKTSFCNDPTIYTPIYYTYTKLLVAHALSFHHDSEASFQFPP